MSHSPNTLLSGLGLASAPPNPPPGGSIIPNPHWSNANAQQQNMYAQMGNQSLLQQQQALSQAYNRTFEQKKWRLDGKDMDVEEFGKEMFGEDTPELTMFLLKYKDVEEKK